MSNGTDWLLAFFVLVALALLTDAFLPGLGDGLSAMASWPFK